MVNFNKMFAVFVMVITSCGSSRMQKAERNNGIVQYKNYGGAGFFMNEDFRFVIGGASLMDYSVLDKIDIVSSDSLDEITGLSKKFMCSPQIIDISKGDEVNSEPVSEYEKEASVFDESQSLSAICIDDMRIFIVGQIDVDDGFDSIVLLSKYELGSGIEFNDMFIVNYQDRRILSIVKMAYYYSSEGHSLRGRIAKDMSKGFVYDVRSVDSDVIFIDSDHKDAESFYTKFNFSEIGYFEYL